MVSWGKTESLNPCSPTEVERPPVPDAPWVEVLELVSGENKGIPAARSYRKTLGISVKTSIVRRSHMPIRVLWIIPYSSFNEKHKL